MQDTDKGVIVAQPVELVQREHITTILDALNRYDVAMTRRKHLTVNVTWQRCSAGVLQSVIPQHTHQHLL